MDIMKMILENEEYMIQMRRHFHTYPGLPGKEEETVKTVREELDKMGIEYVEVPKGGLLGYIHGKKPGKTVMLRGDLDGLPIEEDAQNLSKPKVCVSQNKGICHACGHDGHTAMLLAACKILSENKDQLNGTVMLMFERGEEGTASYVYLYRYIQDKVINIDSCYAIHLYAELASGKILINDVNVMAGGCVFGLEIKGTGGHSSRPDLANSPLNCFLAIADAINNICPRFISPYNTFTSVITQVHMGTPNYNILDDTLKFFGGARIFDYNDGLVFMRELVKIVENTCLAYNCTAKWLNKVGPSFPVKNDLQCARMARKTIGDCLGEGHVVQAEPWMASESMSLHIKLWPGVLALLGIKNVEKGTGAAQHNSQFDIDEDVLKFGAASAAAYAIEFLNSDIETSQSPNKWNGTTLELLKAAGLNESHIAMFNDPQF